MCPENETPTPLMQRVKLQAEVLVPILQRLRAKLGTAEANALIYAVLRDCTRKYIADMASTGTGDPIEDWHRTSDNLEAKFRGDVEYEIVRNDNEVLELKVSSCRYADFFRQIGEPELGEILTCELDDHIADRAGQKLTFSRSNTLMRGGRNCPFHYRFLTDED